LKTSHEGAAEIAGGFSWLFSAVTSATTSAWEELAETFIRAPCPESPIVK
jgi:hypothetical protein